MRRKIKLIEKRNAKVEADKAWEISITRRALIAVFTYVIVVVFLTSIRAANPFLNALVPTGGFIISTLSLPYLKRLWLRHAYKK
jgi:hypothetical protein